MPFIKICREVYGHGQKCLLIFARVVFNTLVFSVLAVFMIFVLFKQFCLLMCI